MSRILSLVLVALVLASAAGYVGCTRSEEPKTETPSQEHEEHGDAHAGHESSGGAELMVTTAPATPTAGEAVSLELMVHGESGKIVTQFDVSHEKLAHLIVVRDGLDEFAHLHPDVAADGRMTVSHTFPVGGAYRLFLDHKPAGQSQATAQAVVHVSGDSPKAPELVRNVPGTITADGMRAEVSLIPGDSANEGTLQFMLQDEAGKPLADLEQYLGAMGHLVVLSADGKQFVHAHPKEETNQPGVVAFAAHFPSPGLYKAWGQFQRASKVHTIPAVVQVKVAE